jgi:hypothetical protein
MNPRRPDILPPSCNPRRHHRPSALAAPPSLPYPPRQHLGGRCMPPFPPPDLPTLDHPASWHNRARRTDRSACLELRCSEILPFIHRAPTPASRGVSPRSVITQNTPRRSSSHSDFEFGASLRPRRQASNFSHFTLTEPLLRAILARRPPASPLAGSLRTAKSNALKTPFDQRLLALPPDWSCDLTILRCPLHPRLTQHFFLCPRCANRQSPIENHQSQIPQTLPDPPHRRGMARCPLCRPLPRPPLRRGQAPHRPPPQPRPLLRGVVHGERLGGASDELCLASSQRRIGRSGVRVAGWRSMCWAWPTSQR